MSRQVEYLNPEGLPPAQGLYSHAGKAPASNLLFVAGQLSVGSDGGIVGKHDFEAQFIQVFQNLGAVLKALGASYTSVVKFTTFLVHAQDIDLFMALRAKHFPIFFEGVIFPPNTLLIVDRLVKEDFLLEVEAIVHDGN